METPEHERRQVIAYLRSQSGDEFEVEHVEKLTTEHVMGMQYDVWDAHTNEGRWWVITNPTNLYDQTQIKSMDVALSFHIGLTSRVRALHSTRRAGNEVEWALEVFRRLGIAEDALNRAKEVEDFQAVGMRLRETLLSATMRLDSLGLPRNLDTTDVKLGDFKARVALVAGEVASGRGAKELRDLLKQVSEKTWAYVNWLTHARHATRVDSQIAHASTANFLDMLFLAIRRSADGMPERCPTCTSYQLTVVHDEEEGWRKLCTSCGWTTATDDSWPPPQEEAEQTERPPIDTECITPEGFSNYSTPREILESIETRTEAGPEEEVAWANVFAVMMSGGEIVDVHRVFLVDRHAGMPARGRELVYVCGEEACVNPDHADPQELPRAAAWTLAVVEMVTFRDDYLEIGVGVSDDESLTMFVGHSVLDQFGFSDASSLLERVVCFADAGEGKVDLLVSERPASHSSSAVARASLEAPPVTK